MNHHIHGNIEPFTCIAWYYSLFFLHVHCMGTLNPSIIPDMVSQSIKDYCSLNCSVNICGLVISYADSSLFLLASWRSQHMRLSHFHAKASRLASIFYAKSTSSNARIFLRLRASFSACKVLFTHNPSRMQPLFFVCI